MILAYFHRLVRPGSSNLCDFVDEAHGIADRPSFIHSNIEKEASLGCLRHFLNLQRSRLESVSAARPSK